MLGKPEGKRRRGQQRIRQFNGIICLMDWKLGKFREIMRDREAWSATVHGKEWDGGTEQQQHHLLYLASFCTNDFYFLPYNSAFKKINNLKINTMVSF